MHRYIETPQPLLTSRVEFTLLPAPAPAALASRTEFTDARLAYPNSAGRSAVNDRESPPPAPQPARRNLRTGGKIAKPPGEPGRPKSGGFTLETALRGIGWTREDVEDLTEAVREAAREKLDISKCYREQDRVAVTKVCDDMMKDSMWPRLKDYDNCWPVRSILKLTLKYGAEAAKRESAKRANRRLQAALRGTSPISPE